MPCWATETLKNFFFPKAHSREPQEWTVAAADSVHPVWQRNSAAAQMAGFRQASGCWENFGNASVVATRRSRGRVFLLAQHAMCVWCLQAQTAPERRPSDFRWWMSAPGVGGAGLLHAPGSSCSGLPVASPARAWSQAPPGGTGSASFIPSPQHPHGTWLVAATQWARDWWTHLKVKCFFRSRSARWGLCEVWKRISRHEQKERRIKFTREGDTVGTVDWLKGELTPFGG